jgi:DNA mismatch repair protein MutS
MNRFDIDTQTFEDLDIFSVGDNRRTLFNIFDKTYTSEGSAALKLIFKNPLTDADLISQRNTLIYLLENSDFKLHLDKETMDFIEFYLRQNTGPREATRVFVFRKTILDSVNPSRGLYIRERGVTEVLLLIGHLRDLLCKLQSNEDLPFLLKRLHIIILEVINNRHINEFYAKKKFDLTIAKSLIYDFELRRNELGKIMELLSLVYELDAYVAVAKTSKEHKLCYPKINRDETKLIAVKQLRHIFINKPVPNDFYLSSSKNVAFLTGVNMAGKSTFLKSIAIAVYLVHLGFPVPADEMESSTFDGLISTINISDDLNEGYSHFYNEVRRVKAVAEKINDSKNLFVIFDELFRGTNVKDAHDASVLIIDRFSKISNCLFLISTHIVEVAEALSTNPNINFSFLKTTMIDGKPSFSHHLFPGITADRMGTWIVQNEGIIELLSKNVKR